MTDTSTQYDNYELNDIYEEVSDLNDPEVLLGIAHHYRDGNGVEKNQEIYLNYLNKAADAGNEKAIAERDGTVPETSENTSEDTSVTSKTENLNVPLTGKESVSELISMADNGNNYASLELLKQAFSLSTPDKAMIRKYGKMLNDYIHNGEADSAKADIAYQTGDLYDQHNYSTEARIFYDAAREYGSNEASVRLIPILCKEGKAESAYEAYRNLNQISDDERVKLLRVLGDTFVGQNQSPLIVKGICEELAGNPAATEEDQMHAKYLTTLVSEGWDGVFKHADNPYYAKQLKKHYNNAVEINKLTEEQFETLLNIYRQGSQSYLLNFLSFCIAFGNDTIRNYIYNSTPEFKDGTLINYLLYEPNSRYKTTRDYYTEAIRTYRSQQREYYNEHLSELMEDPGNYEKIKEVYLSSVNLAQSVDQFQTLLGYFRNHNDKDAVIQLLGTGLLTSNDELYQMIITSPEFKNGELAEFMSTNSGKGNVSKAQSYYSQKYDNQINHIKTYLAGHKYARIIVVVLAALIVFRMGACVVGSMDKSIKPLDYATVSFSGTNGYAKTSVSLNYDKLSAAADQEVTKDDVSIKAPKSTNIKNGDHVTINLKVNESNLDGKKLTVKSKNLQKTFKVSGLKKGRPVDPFKDIKVTEKGGNGYGHIKVKSTSDDPFLKTITYKVENNKNLSNGATVRIKAKADVDTVNLYGEYPSKTETTYKLSNLGTCPTDISQINEDDIRKLADDFTNNPENITKLRASTDPGQDDPVLSHAFLISNHGKKLNTQYGSGYTNCHDVLVLVYYVGGGWVEKMDSIAFGYPDITIDANGNIKQNSVDFNFDRHQGPDTYDNLKNFDYLLNGNSISEKDFN